MDDLSERIQSLLGDPDGMQRLKSMAESLLGGEEKPRAPEPQSDIDISKLLPLIQRFNQKKSDKRTDLLEALRPHLSERRQERVDSAIKILRLIDMLPLIQESGLFNAF